jgi:hypothetical protein
MDFRECAKNLNRTLREKNPPEFSSAWILKNHPSAYHFIYKNVRNDIGGIDWDRVTAALGRRYQRRWMRYRRKPRKEYENPDEIEKVLGKCSGPLSLDSHSTSFLVAFSFSHAVIFSANTDGGILSAEWILV